MKKFVRQYFRQHWLVILIAALAAGVRLFRLDTLTSFQGDQGRDLLAVWDMVANYNLTLLGPPSTFGPFQGPLYYYLLAPGMFVAGLSVVGPLVTAVFFNVAGLVLLYFFAQRFFSQHTAVVASFVYAVSPLLTEVGRTLLNAYVGMPFFIAALWLLIDIAIYRRRNWQRIALLGILAGVLVQLHYNYAPLFLFVFVVPVMYTIRRKLRFYGIYLTFFIIASLPQIAFEFRHEFLNTQLLVQSLQTGQAQSAFSFDYIAFFLSTVGYVFGWENAWFGGLVLLGIVGGLAWLRRLGRIRKLEEMKLLGGYSTFFLGAAVFSRVRLVFPAYHYYMSIFPILLLASGSVLAHQRKRVITVVLGVFVIVAGFNLNLFANHGFTMVDNWSLQKQEEIADIVAADAADTQRWNIVSVVDGDTQALPFRFHLAARGADGYLGPEQYPQSNPVYLVTRDEKQLVFEYTVWEVASIQPFAIDAEWFVQPDFHIYRLSRRKD